MLEPPSQITGCMGEFPLYLENMRQGPVLARLRYSLNSTRLLEKLLRILQRDRLRKRPPLERVRHEY